MFVSITECDVGGYQGYYSPAVWKPSPWSQQHHIPKKQNHIFLTLNKSFFKSLNHYPFNPVTSFVFYSLGRSLEYHHFHPPISTNDCSQRQRAKSVSDDFARCDISYVISFNGSIMRSPIHSSATCRVHGVQCWSKSECLLYKFKTSILWTSQCIIKHVPHVSEAWCIKMMFWSNITQARVLLSKDQLGCDLAVDIRLTCLFDH